MARRVGLIGVPTSAGAFAPGQEQAPAALRQAATVAAIVRETAERVGAFARDSRTNAPTPVALVLGGDCTVGIGTVAGALAAGEDLGLLYFDTHAGLNVPDSVTEGALDWMGMAHMLAEPGARPELVWVGPRAPLLRDDQVLLFGWGPEQATEFEREAIARRGLERIAVDEVAANPRAPRPAPSPASKPAATGSSSISTSTSSTSPTRRSRRTGAATRGCRSRRRWPPSASSSPPPSSRR
jgi:arginase